MFASKGRTGMPFNDIVEGMPDFGQGEGWTSLQWWWQGRRRNVRLDALIGTNLDRYLNEKRVIRYMESGRGGDIRVVECRGYLYVADGHHRATAAWRRGEKKIRARVMRVD